MKKILSVFLAFILAVNSFSQDSCNLRVSLLTCTPGSELYSIFGHSAMRVVDSKVGTDIVYNYGTFDFNDPAFYSKFIRGKLLYYLSQENFGDFIYSYQMDNRGIDEQVLNLDCGQLQKLQQFLFTNLQADNRFYKYDFLLDNCTTRLRDIIENNDDGDSKTDDIPDAKGMSFRDAIHFYLDNGKAYWSKLGIDLLLGSRIDRKMTNREAMFLPEFLERAVDLTHSSKKGSIVKVKLTPVVKADNDSSDNLWMTPSIIFSMLAIAMILMGFSRQKLFQDMLHYFDILLFLAVGLTGCLMLFMWFGTDHRDCGSNYNVIWAWPTHVVAAVMLIFRKRPIPNYFLAYSIVTLLVLAGWAVLPQQLNLSIIPILVLVIWRSWKIGKPA